MTNKTQSLLMSVALVFAAGIGYSYFSGAGCGTLCSIIKGDSGNVQTVALQGKKIADTKAGCCAKGASTMVAGKSCGSAQTIVAKSGCGAATEAKTVLASNATKKSCGVAPATMVAETKSCGAQTMIAEKKGCVPQAAPAVMTVSNEMGVRTVANAEAKKACDPAACAKKVAEKKACDPAACAKKAKTTLVKSGGCGAAPVATEADDAKVITVDGEGETAEEVDGKVTAQLN